MHVPEGELRERRAAAYENPRPDVQRLVPEADQRRWPGRPRWWAWRPIRSTQNAPAPSWTASSVPTSRTWARGRARWGGFDCIVAADVLEHLRDPWLVLSQAVTLLAPGGSVVVSLPNVRYFWALGRLLLRDRWPRESEGIFDATHLRWFAAPDARELVESAGLVEEQEAPQYRLRPGDRRTERAATLLAHGPLRSLLTVQHLLRGRLS